MEFAKVGTSSFILFGLGILLSLLIPLAIALLWKFKKNERFTTILVGAATFFLFALVLEKSLQALVISMDHPLSRFLKATPVLWALVVALFPGIFEETGRLVAYKTVLKKFKNRETAISHGIGHGGFEMLFLMVAVYINYITYALMINNGTFGSAIEKVAAKAPDKVAEFTALAQQVAGITILDVGAGFIERASALLFHIGASILVFYACKKSKKFWLYPLAILLHILMDFPAGLYIVKVFTPPKWLLEVILALFGVLTFCGAYFLLYRKDEDVLKENSQEAAAQLG